MKFINALPEWENEGIQPPEELLKSGFQAGYKPPAAIFNWFWSKVCKCITELQNSFKTHSETPEIHRRIYFGDTKPEGNNWLWFAPYEPTTVSEVILNAESYSDEADKLHVETDGKLYTAANTKVENDNGLSVVIIE